MKLFLIFAAIGAGAVYFVAPMIGATPTVISTTGGASGIGAPGNSAKIHPEYWAVGVALAAYLITKDVKAALGGAVGVGFATIPFGLS